VVHRFDGTHAGQRLRVDGSDQLLDSRSAGAPGTTPFSAILDIGSRADGTDWWLDGAIAELIVYNRVLEDLGVSAVECYLARRYAIAIDGCTPELRVRPRVAAVSPGATVPLAIAGGLAPYTIEVVTGPGLVEAESFRAPSAASTTEASLRARYGLP
jgi:hypothetical protein